MPQPLVTILVTMTRAWVVEEFMVQLNALETDPSRTDLVLIVDSADRKIPALVLEHLDAGRFRNIVKVQNRNIVNERSPKVRRSRIAWVLNRAKVMIGETDYVLGLEDDTDFPPRTLKEFLAIAKDTADFGIVSGIQVGRWGCTMVGIWRADQLTKPERLWTVAPGRGIQRVDATGFYCFLTPTELFKSVNHAWGDPAGPDVHYGLELRKRGYRVLADWDVPCGHRTEKGTLRPSDVDIKQIRFQKDGGTWRRVRAFPI